METKDLWSMTRDEVIQYQNNILFWSLRKSLPYQEVENILRKIRNILLNK